MPLLVKILIASILSGVFSLIGGVALLGKVKWVRKFTIHFVSFATGALLAVSFLDLLPESLSSNQVSIEAVSALVLTGLLASFIIERLILHFHVHHHGETADHQHATPLLLLVGDSIHNLIDGVAVGSSFLANPALGVTTALGVAAHEIPQEIGNFSIMLQHGWSRRKVLILNIIVSLTNVLGAVIAYLAKGRIELILPIILALTAGNFIYIASSDLIPQISSVSPTDKTSHVLLLICTGIASVWLLKFYFGG